MKKLFFIFTLFINTSCTGNNNVYWCGDHPCINKKEKEAYFKETMIVEVRNLKENNHKKNSEIEKIIQRARLSEKERIKTHERSSIPKGSTIRTALKRPDRPAIVFFEDIMWQD